MVLGHGSIGFGFGFLLTCRNAERISFVVIEIAECMDLFCITHIPDHSQLIWAGNQMYFILPESVSVHHLGFDIYHNQSVAIPYCLFSPSTSTSEGYANVRKVTAPTSTKPPGQGCETWANYEGESRPGPCYISSESSNIQRP